MSCWVEEMLEIAWFTRASLAASSADVALCNCQDVGQARWMAEEAKIDVLVSNENPGLLEQGASDRESLSLSSCAHDEQLVAFHIREDGIRRAHPTAEHRGLQPVFRILSVENR